jgi:hypothetical protein
MRTGTKTAGAALMILGLGAAAQAQEYCVSCTGPDAMYRCVLEGGPGVAPPASRAQLLCITELARSGGHASCSVGRATGEQCLGEPRTVVLPASPEPGIGQPINAAQPQPLAPLGEPGTTAAGTTVEGQPSPDPDAAGDGDVEPSAAAKIAKQTVDASNAGLKKAGEAVNDTATSAGNAAKKTWNCVTSLFSDC